MKIDRYKVSKAIKGVTEQIDDERVKAKALADTLHVVHFDAKTAKVAEQVFAVLPPGVKRAIRCPYCRHLNIEGGQFCCVLLRGAIRRVLDAKPEKVAVN
ncbi:MAG TPA: hypothetical protein VGK24_05765 [Candidatus Angelobacter sp.]|jgi:hypothetical protein